MEESNPILDFKSNKTTTSKPQSKLGDFILGDILGRGTFGQVVMAIHVPTGEKVNSK